MSTPAQASDADSASTRRPLSPSRAGDFKQCPLLYRFRTIDRLPETPTVAQVRGTVVHAVLERLFDLPPADRTRERAAELLGPAWEEIREQQPDVAQLFQADGAPAPDWLATARQLVDGYFELEDPRRLQPQSRELLVEAELESGLAVRGYVDRLDVAPGGEMRVVDYKTGSAPREIGEARAMFQLKFYAVALWRTTGEVPRQLRLMYLADRQNLVYSPDEDELRRFERTVDAIGHAIDRARETGDFRPNPSKLCQWCDHHAHCPAQGGTLPPWPEQHPAE